MSSDPFDPFAVTCYHKLPFKKFRLLHLLQALSMEHFHLQLYVKKNYMKILRKFLENSSTSIRNSYGGLPPLLKSSNSYGALPVFSTPPKPAQSPVFMVTRYL
jgi:hypothetical protein